MIAAALAMPQKLRHINSSSFRSFWLYKQCLLKRSSMCIQLLSRVSLLATWTGACQAPLPMEFSRQEYWSGMPFPSPGALPNLGTEPMSLVSPALVGRFFPASRKPTHSLLRTDK